MGISRSKRHFKRYREIAAIIGKHGWGWTLERLGMAEHRTHDAVEKGDDAPVHIREALEELGPTFVKMGQLLSSRPDIVPEPIIDELIKLQDTAPTLPVKEIYAVIETEFDAPIADLFEYFNEIPLAAASIAQVHEARLLDETPVIVKVQRPNIRNIVETDIEILYKRAKFLESHWEKARTYGFTDLVDEFAITIREELDFTREARHTDRLYNAVSNQTGVKVPIVYWNLTTSKVLSLERIDGTKITEVVDDPVINVDPKVIAKRLADSFLEQVFVDGFFHADPHPGNILVSCEGDIVLLDAGQVGRLDAESRAGAVRLLMAYEQQDSRIFADEILNLGISSGDVDNRRLTLDLGKILRSYYDTPARSANMGQILTRVLEVSARYKVRLPVSFAVLGKVFTNIEGICRQLDPDFNFTEVARQYIGRAVKKELQSENAQTEIYRALVGLRNFLLNSPENLDRLMRKAIEGNFRLEFKHLGTEDLSNSLETSSNRISIALVVGAIIVGSSFIVAAGRGSTSWFGLPTLGVVGYVVATIFGIWLIYSILRPSSKSQKK